MRKGCSNSEGRREKGIQGRELSRGLGLQGLRDGPPGGQGEVRAVTVRKWRGEGVPPLPGSILRSSDRGTTVYCLSLPLGGHQSFESIGYQDDDGGERAQRVYHLCFH